MYCFGKKVEVFFFFKTMSWLDTKKDEYVEIEKLKYEMPLHNSN